MQSTVNPNELNERFSRGACQLIDVREPVEHAEMHIPGARLIPLGELQRRVSEISRDLPVVIHCRSGKRGEAALATLKALGFTEVVNLAGGILAWRDAGMAVARADKKVFPLMQQVQLIIGLGTLAGAILAMTVDPAWIWLCVVFGAGVSIAGATGWCALAMLVSRMPWNRVDGRSACAGKSCTVC